MQQDIRWRHSFEDFRKAYAQLDEALTITQPSMVERAGIIHLFELTAELAWNTLTDLLQYQGAEPLTGNRDAIRKAFKHGLLNDGMGWMKMLESRKLTLQSYQEDIAAALLADIQQIYHELFKDLLYTLEAFISASES